MNHLAVGTAPGAANPGHTARFWHIDLQRDNGLMSHPGVGLICRPRVGGALAFPGVHGVAAAGAVAFRSEGASTIAMAIAAPGSALFRRLMPGGTVPQFGTGVPRPQGGVAHGTIELHALGVQEMVKCDAAQAGWYHHPDRERFVVGGCRRQHDHRGQKH